MSKNEDNKSLVENINNFVGLEDLPAPVTKGLLKALYSLGGVLVDIPIAYLEGKAENIRAETKSRNQLLDVSTKQIAKEMKVDPKVVERAALNNSRRIVRRQKNMDNILKKTIEEIKESDNLKVTTSKEAQPEVSEDWLDSFYSEACKKSTEDMQLRFAKVLSGQITGKNSYSLRCIRRLGDIDSGVANIFQKFCSCMVVLRDMKYAYRGCLVHVNDNHLDPINGLKKYGLGFGELQILTEYELIGPSLNSITTLENKNGSVFIEHQDKSWLWQSASDNTPLEKYQVQGTCLSQLGQELATLVENTPQEAYHKDLQKYLERKGIAMIEFSPLIS